MRIRSPEEELNRILLRYIQDHDPVTKATARAMIFSEEFEQLCDEITIDADSPLNADYIRRMVLEREK